MDYVWKSTAIPQYTQGGRAIPTTGFQGLEHTPHFASNVWKNHGQNFQGLENTPPTRSKVWNTFPSSLPAAKTPSGTRSGLRSVRVRIIGQSRRLAHTG